MKTFPHLSLPPRAPQAWDPPFFIIPKYIPVPSPSGLGLRFVLNLLAWPPPSQIRLYLSICRPWCVSVFDCGRRGAEQAWWGHRRGSRGWEAGRGRRRCPRRSWLSRDSAPPGWRGRSRPEGIVHPPNRVFTGPSGNWAENDHEEQRQEREVSQNRTRPGGTVTQQDNWEWCLGTASGRYSYRKTSVPLTLLPVPVDFTDSLKGNCLFIRACLRALPLYLKVNTSPPQGCFRRYLQDQWQHYFYFLPSVFCKRNWYTDLNKMVVLRHANLTILTTCWLSYPHIVFLFVYLVCSPWSLNLLVVVW